MESALKKTLKSFKTNESTISAMLGGLVVVIAVVLLVNYFKTDKSAEITPEAQETVATAGKVELMQTEEGKLTPKGLPASHTVQAGESLWKISEQYFGNGYNWVDIAEANGLTDPGAIEVNQLLTIPQVELRYTKDVQMAQKQGDLLEATSYTVQKGDFLWDIALRAYGDGYRWVDIFEANKDKINHPNYIEIGMELALPR